LVGDKPRKVGFAKARVADDPIPKTDIIEGRPRARTFMLHADPDGHYACGIWHCSPGRFHWNFGVDEFVYIIDGEARVRYDDGHKIVVRKGDVAHFPKGHCVWHVTKKVKKVFVMRE